ncbi:Hsp70 family protein [Pseudonocardia broussonetiae]|uniref:Hsp70 family protein n=1 Tax=Pseudonocardia broussonetiae TaxID=2736640 RepID=A0A6M6JGG4_9PSEU|nr:Hsp70 family protein [Pseudonocardia broussonetiae]QJY47084.1 Hsp70 family protein [Pseudonocardia broussonetiae]
MYQLGVDLGTTWSAAAVCRDGARTAEPVPLGEHGHAVASAVFAGADGSFLLGEAAERRALSDPDRVVREFKRRIGDPTPVLVGREPVPAEVLAARFVAALVRQVSQREGGPPSRIAVTHPAGWGPHKTAALRAALAAQGVGPLVLLSEPQAAAVGYASAERVEAGSVVAVYDLGGGTFDAAVVRKDPRGGFALLGTPEGIERLGGVDFDEAVFAHVRDAIGPAWAELDGTDPAVLEAVARLRRECTAAKEALSVDTVVQVPVMLPGLHTRVRLGRAEFEDMVRPAIAETVDALARALASAGVAPADVATLLLVGGSSRMPLVTELVSAGIGRPASADVDPKGVIAAGAALVARGASAPAAEALAAHGAGAMSTDDGSAARVAALRAAASREGSVRDAAARDATVRAVPVRGAAVGSAAAGGAAVGGAAAGGAAVGGAAVGGPGRGAAGPGPAGEPPVTRALRPPRPARPFAEVEAAATRRAIPRRVLAAAAASVLAAGVLGGAILFANRAGPDASAATPDPTTLSRVEPAAPTTTTAAPEPVEPEPEPEPPAPEPEPEPAPRTAPRTAAPPAPTTAPPTIDPTTAPPTTTDPTTAPPDTGAAEGSTSAAPAAVEGAVVPVVPDAPAVDPADLAPAADPTGAA